MKIRPVGTELLHADGPTDMTKLTVAFRNFANAPYNNRQWKSAVGKRSAMHQTRNSILCGKLFWSQAALARHCRQHIKQFECHSVTIY
jgi:hypothetical protein